MSKPQTHYELLGVDMKASTTQIINAYKVAKAAFTEGDAANYSLMSHEDREKELLRIETAYRTLTSREEREAYDAQLQPTSSARTTPTGFLGAMDKNNKAHSQKTRMPHPSPVPDETAAPQQEEELLEISGPILREIREKRGLSLQHLEQKTKIKKSYLKAIEEDDINELPARVYVQGFVKSLAHIYQLPKEASAEKYLKHLDDLKHAHPALKPLKVS